MDWFQALILGLVQGLTELIPISSTAHLIIVPHWLGWEDPGTDFSAIIQLGTLVAIIVFFWRDIIKLVGAVTMAMCQGNMLNSEEAKLAWSIFWNYTDSSTGPEVQGLDQNRSTVSLGDRCCTYYHGNFSLAQCTFFPQEH